MSALNDVVKIVSFPRTDDGRGAGKIDKNNPVLVAETRAHVKWVSNREVERTGGRIMETDVIIRIRDPYYPFSEDMNILFKHRGALYLVAIKEIKPSDKHVRQTIVNAKKEVIPYGLHEQYSNLFDPVPAEQTGGAPGSVDRLARGSAAGAHWDPIGAPVQDTWD